MTQRTRVIKLFEEGRLTYGEAMALVGEFDLPVTQSTRTGMAGDYEIEKGIKMPSAYNSHRYPFDEMEVGDSFFVPEDDAALSTIKNATYPRNRGTGKKFSVRPVENGTRVWRTQ